MRNGSELYRRIADRKTMAQRWNDLSDEVRAETTYNEWRKKNA